MITETQIKCVGCEEILDDEYTHSNVKDDALCYGCEESDLQDASTLVRIQNGEVESVRIGDYLIYDKDMEIPNFFRKISPKSNDVRKWTKTDAWRGHGSTIENFEGIKVLASGWMTGWADEYHQRKNYLNEFLQKLNDGDFSVKYPIYVLIEQTSNVFSQSLDIFTEEIYAEPLAQWLDEIGYPVQNLKDWLS